MKKGKRGFEGRISSLYHPGSMLQAWKNDEVKIWLDIYKQNGHEASVRNGDGLESTDITR